MKRKLVLLFQPVMVCLLFACTLHQADWTIDVQGSYVTSYQQPYSIGWDTLTFQINNHKSPFQFCCIRRTKYQRLKNNTTGKPTIREDRFTCTPDKENQTLTAGPSGRIYHYDPEAQTIQIGNKIYQKIK